MPRPPRLECEDTDILALREALQDRPSIDEILKVICELTQEKQSNLITRKPGRQVKSPIRSFAMYACHYYCQVTHKAIAKRFGLKHVGSVCYPLAKIKREIEEGKWGKLIKAVEKRFYIIQYT